MHWRVQSQCIIDWLARPCALLEADAPPRPRSQRGAPSASPTNRRRRGRGPCLHPRPLTPPPSPSHLDAPPPLTNNEQPATMDSFRIKRVVNEVAASLEQHRALPNFDQNARRTCREVVVLLLEGQAGYDLLNMPIVNYQGLRTSAELAESAVRFAAVRWNENRASSGVYG